METIKILIVEDDPMVMQVNKQYVDEIEGFELIATAESGREAIQQVKIHQPQLVILDVYLPDLDGVQTLQEIRKLNMPTDVIMVTAAKDVDTIQKAFRYGAIDYIVKPFRFDRLKEALESYIIISQKFQRKSVLTQEEIDVMKQSKVKTYKKSSDKDILPKGLNDVTLKQILLCLIKEQSGMSAEEVAEGVGLARVTARRYLDYLEKEGKVLLEIQYGSVGRPINRYKLT
ncbi:MAG: response regulator [Bacillota bacterium]|nr:response regulator [Bacillota bacterium]